MANRYAAFQPADDALPTNVAHGFLKRTAAGTAWEQAAYGTSPANVGTAAADGTANTPSRSDHVHDLPETVLRSVAAELTAALDVNGQKITNGATPTSAGDFATKGFVESVAAGLRDPKDSCRLATAAAPAAYTRVANVITFTAVGAQTVDGVVPALNERVLLKNGAAGADNGLYYVSTKGTGAIAEVWTRTTDADTDAEVTSGLTSFIEEGTTNAGSSWTITTANPITLNTTALSFTQTNGAGQITAGTGMTKTGNTLDVGAGNGIQVNADTVEVLYAVPSTTQDAAGASAGSANTALRTDCKLGYDMELVGGIAAVGTANAAGTSNKFARGDHGHAHGDQTVATLHAAATPSANGFLASTDKKKIDDVLGGATDAGTVTTSDATVTTAGNIGTGDNQTIIVEATVVARRTDVAGTGAVYKLSAAFRRGVGAATLTQIGSTDVIAAHEDNAAMDATLDADTTVGSVRCRVTGIAAQTFNWQSRMTSSIV